MFSAISTVVTARVSEHLNQSIRYAFVGFTALCFDYSTMIVLTEIAGAHYLVSATAGFLTGLIVNYNLAIRFVFHKGKLHNKKLEFLIFAVIGGGGMLITAGLMWLFTDYLSLHYTHSKLVTVLLVFLWNFYARKLILFHG